MLPNEKLTDLDLAFPAQVMRLLPKWEDIPEDYRKQKHKTTRIVDDLFYVGLKANEIVPKEGIDKVKALRHIKAIMGSYEPKHEHKIAGVAYLIDQWFDKFDVEPAKTKEELLAELEGRKG